MRSCFDRSNATKEGVAPAAAALRPRREGLVLRVIVAEERIAETCGGGQYNLRGRILAVVKIHSSRHVCLMLIGIVVVPLYFTTHSIVF